ncbi:hypothetical protein SB912_32170, partial [Pantoea sp. SIMBA_072]
GEPASCRNIRQSSSCAGSRSLVHHARKSEVDDGWEENAPPASWRAITNLIGSGTRDGRRYCCSVTTGSKTSDSVPV